MSSITAPPCVPTTLSGRLGGWGERGKRGVGGREEGESVNRKRCGVFAEPVNEKSRREAKMFFVDAKSHRF